MKRTQFVAIMLGIIATLPLRTPNSAYAQTAAPAADLTIGDWERAKAYTLEYLHASSDDVIAFKPTPDMRSFGQQMLHIAEANYGFGAIASGKASPFTFGDLEKAADKYKTKDALTKAVLESYDFIISAIKDTDKSKLGETIKVFNRFEMTRAVAFEKAFEHQTHHRGQTTVYLRLKGVTPPNEKLF